METKIFYTKDQLSRYFGDFLAELTGKQEVVYIALSGGSTPENIFDVLSQEYKDSIRWDRLRFFWGDERCVPPDHAESNYRMTREHLFNHVPVSEEQIFRIKGELTPEEALKDYRRVLEETLPQKNGFPQFDVMVLGMGDDGHTASIFPHEISLWDSPNWCEIGTHPKTGQKRITLTGKVINNSRQIIFLVTGKNKAPKVDEILHQKGNYLDYPAARVDPRKSLWLLDQQAAQRSDD